MRKYGQPHYVKSVLIMKFFVVRIQPFSFREQKCIDHKNIYFFVLCCVHTVNLTLDEKVQVTYSRKLKTFIVQILENLQDMCLGQLFLLTAIMNMICIP